MKYVIENIDQVKEPGVYCCHIVSASWTEMVLHADTEPDKHVSGDCLIQLTKDPGVPAGWTAAEGELPAGHGPQTLISKGDEEQAARQRALNPRSRDGH